MLCKGDLALLFDQPGRLKSIVETSLHLFEPLLKASLVIDALQSELLGQFNPSGPLLLYRVIVLGDAFLRIAVLRSLFFLFSICRHSLLESSDLSPRFLHHLLI